MSGIAHGPRRGGIGVIEPAQRSIILELRAETERETTFDGGGSGGNSLVTSRTAYVVDSTTDQRVTKHKFDAKYTIDNLNRVTGAQEGHMSGGSIANEYRDELWTLTQTGNWSLNRVDLNGDNDYIDTDELDDTRTHAPVNEILTRNTNSAGGVEFTLTYNLRGDLEDEGGTGGYKYVWDAFGRLVEVRRQNGTLLAEYRYNGLNQRISWHYDATGNSTTDGSDPTYHFCYDEKWRIMGTWRGTDSEPKELFTYQQAGLAGHGGSSYIDTVLMRDRDITNGWTGSGDGTREQRHYYAQNWRADVAAVFDNAGDIQEWDKYSSYGIPFLLTPGDFNKDGTVDKDDDDLFTADYGTSNPRADLNKDGSVTTADQTIFNASYAAAEKGGRYKLSSTTIGNRKGYSGYEHEGFGNDTAVPQLAHVRNRVLHFGLGRWTRRDPLGYVDGTSLYEAAKSNAIRARDPVGLCCSDTTGPSDTRPNPNPKHSWGCGPRPGDPYVNAPESGPCNLQSQGGECASQCRGGRAGSTTCYQNGTSIRRHCCVCDLNIYTGIPIGTPGVKGILACVEEHERHHRDSQSWCWRLGGPAGPQSCCEYESLGVEWECLQRQLEACGNDAVCQETIRRWIGDTENEMLVFFDRCTRLAHQ